MNAKFLPSAVRNDAQLAFRPFDDAIPAREPAAVHATVRARPGTSPDVAA